jgi:hypothetical protein
MQAGDYHNIDELSRLVDLALSVPTTTTTKSVIGTSDYAEGFRASTFQRIIPVIHNPKLLAANRDRT